MWALRRASTNSLIVPGLNTAAFRACAGLGPIIIQKEDKSAAVKPHFPTLDRWITSKTCNCIVPVPELFSVGFRFLSSQAGIESGGEETLKTDLLEDTEGDAGKITLSGLSALSTLVFEESSESISGALNNYFEGKKISRSEVYQALLNFRKHKLFEKAFQLLAWLEGRADFDFSGRDYASMVDLIAKVHGLQKAEVYLDNIPKSFREEVIFRTSLANYVSATLKKSKQLQDKMESSGMACFVESPTSDNANDLRFMGREKTSLLFPFFGATFFFQRDGLRVYNNLTLKDAREQLLGQLRKKCWNLMGKEAVLKLTEKSIDQDGMRELMKGTEMLTQIILKNRRIPYGYNTYLNEVKKMRNILSNRTSTDTIIESVKIRSVYQSAAMIAQDICMDLKKKNQSFRSIFSRIVRMVPVGMKKSGSRVEGIRICVSGRLRGAEIAKTECGKYGKTSCNTISQKIDYAAAEASTRYGNLGVKVWISYSSS